MQAQWLRRHLSARSAISRPVKTPGCSENCAYAYSCHEYQMGRSTVFWLGVALIMLVVLGAFL